MSTSFFGGEFFGGEFFNSTTGVDITPCDLYDLDIAYQGQPFVHISTSGIDTYELDTAFQGTPFIGVECVAEEPVVEEEEYRHGGKDDKRRGKKNLIFKPTGIEDRKPKPVVHEGRKTVEERVEETRDIAAAVREVAQQEFARADQYQPTIETMTLAEIDAEIGLLMRKVYRSREDEEILMLLMLVAQAL